MKYADLTGTIENGMWTFGSPLDPVRLETVGNLKTEGWISHNVRMGILSGTYLETAAHVRRGGPTLDSYPIGRFIVKALVAKISKAPATAVTGAELEPWLKDRADAEAVIVNTGWHRHWGRRDFLVRTPCFDKDAAVLLAAARFKIVGADMVGFDPPGSSRMRNLITIFKSGAIILSPLVNLDCIPVRHVTLIALPLKFKKLNASPCRAVAYW